MEVGKANILKFLGNDTQFVLPKYQRRYSWDIEHCEQLWNDLVNIQRSGRASYFIGSIVNKAEGNTPSGVKVQRFTLIDGQQRMATIMLMLIALRNWSLDNPGDTTINAKEIEDLRLKNQYASGSDRYKLLLVGEDREVLSNLIEGVNNPAAKYSKLRENYEFLEKKICGNELKPAEVYEAIGKLQIVNITLEANDDAQAIFESLNSTGKDLSKSDLIRNFVLMGLDHNEQSDVYDKFWSPMEKLFGNDKQDKLMDDFFRDYLTMKLSRVVREDRVYEEFKRWYMNSDFNGKVDELCKDIKTYATYYTDIIFARSNIPELQKLYAEIKGIRMEVSYPFILKVHEDFRNGLITEDDLLEILRLCVSYVIRRHICGIATNGLNKTFVTLHNEIDESDYMNSLRAKWVTLERSSRFPDDKEFADAFVKKDIFHMDKRRYYILGKLENFGNKQPIIDPSNLTIEHVMPQNERLSREWRDELGSNWREVQREYLHRIGNLTLTGYNSELGDRPFKEKLTMKDGYIQSGLKLSSFIKEQTHWNEETIKERAKILAEQALKIWEYPSAVAKPVEPTPTSEYSLEDYTFSELTRNLYDKLDRRIMNLSSEVSRRYLQMYIAYRLDTNFAAVVVTKSKLKIYVNMRLNDVKDPKGLCRDSTNRGYWGTGSVEVIFDDPSQLDDVMEIVEQSFNEQSEE